MSPNDLLEEVFSNESAHLQAGSLGRPEHQSERHCETMQALVGIWGELQELNEHLAKPDSEGAVSVELEVPIANNRSDDEVCNEASVNAIHAALIDAGQEEAPPIKFGDLYDRVGMKSISFFSDVLESMVDKGKVICHTTRSEPSVYSLPTSGHGLQMLILETLRKFTLPIGYSHLRQEVGKPCGSGFYRALQDLLRDKKVIRKEGNLREDSHWSLAK